MAAKTAAPVRVAMYYRVSSKEQLQGYSLDAQVRAIESYCAARGHLIVARYPEPARSARTDDIRKRPAFRQMLDDADAHRFDILIVHKLDRFARNLRIQLESFGRLERAGVAFVSLSEQMDLTTSQGRMQ